MTQMKKLAIIVVVLLSTLGATWTWPGHLGTHLRHHGFTVQEINRMSFRQQRATHDAIHNRVRRNYPKRSDANLIRHSNHIKLCPHCGRRHQ